MTDSAKGRERATTIANMHVALEPLQKKVSDGAGGMARLVVD